jgi:hypothetical protein
MTYHGTVEQGVIVLEAGAILPEGTRVEVFARVDDNVASQGEAIASQYGIWRDRTDLPADSSHAATELRRQAWRTSANDDDSR